MSYTLKSAANALIANLARKSALPDGLPRKRKGKRGGKGTFAANKRKQRKKK